jgi:glycosyltransferase involved in cell wall biosynthesis
VVNRPPDDIRILWGSPLPPTRSGVADYAFEILPELASLVPVRVLSPPGWRPPDDWPGALEIAPTDAPAEAGEIVLIHLGNNPHHQWLLRRLHSQDHLVPVVHDAVLHHLLVESTLAFGDAAGFVDRLADAHPGAGEALAAARRVGHHGRLDPFLFPARGAFLKHANAVIVHSRWAQKLVADDLPGRRVGRVDLAVADPGPIDRAAVRARLGLSGDEVVVMHLGFLTPGKGLAEILTGVAAASRMGLQIRLAVVGEGDGMKPLLEAAARVGIEDRVLTTGWIDPGLFPAVPAAADLGVALRTPSAGETSAATLRFFACGVPVAVGGNRQFLELPEAAAPRLTPGPSAAADLARLLAEIGTTRWADRGRAARSTYLESHRPAQAARAMVEFLASLSGRP